MDCEQKNYMTEKNRKFLEKYQFGLQKACKLVKDMASSGIIYGER